MKNYKKLLAGILLMSMCISSTLTVLPTKAATKYAAWQYAYCKFIDKKEYESYGNSNNRFHLAYIDGDSIPELVYHLIARRPLPQFTSLTVDRSELRSLRVNREGMNCLCMYLPYL